MDCGARRNDPVGGSPIPLGPPEGAHSDPPSRAGFAGLRVTHGTSTARRLVYACPGWGDGPAEQVEDAMSRYVGALDQGTTSTRFMWSATTC